MLESIVGFAVGIIGNYVATTTQPPIPNPWQRRLDDQLADRDSLDRALASVRSLRDEVRRACREQSRNQALLGPIDPKVREVWLLLSDVRFQDALADWLMAGGIAEGDAARADLEDAIERALRRGGATDPQIAAWQADYFETLNRAIFANPLLAAWRHQLSLDYLRERVDAAVQAAERAAGIYPAEVRREALENYLEQALREWDIIDLSNLPEGDIHIATQKLLLRQLYVPLRVTVEIDRDRAAEATAFDALEQRREARRRAAAGWSPGAAAPTPGSDKRVPVGERLGLAGRLVVLGDPGGGKTTLLRWMATAYLLRYRDDPALAHLPDLATLPEGRWLPVLIRCRNLGEADLSRSFIDFLAQHLLKTELRPDEADVMRAVILEQIAAGEVLLLVDGLDEITNQQVRVQFCQELERTAARYPAARFVVTSRVVGYRDMPYRMGGGFEHGLIADLTGEDKDHFARRWIELTDHHRSRRDQEELIADLITALHSSDRIERLTGNPMLLTTLALVKRKVGKLPNRRTKLYAEAIGVLLNWNPRHYETIDEDEAVPQLAYLAYEMARRGVQRLGEEEVLGLLERMRQDHPNIRALRRRTPEEFLALLEARSSILIASGGSWRNDRSRAEPVWEFRHLTLQEYLAAQALLKRRYPDRNRQSSLAEEIAPLAGTLKQEDDPNSELEVSDSWQETLRLLVADAGDDDVDEVLLAILRPMDGEDPARTARPRAVLAARCLADEPNVLEETAREVLEAFAAQVSERDANSPDTPTSLDRAAVEVGRSIWLSLLKHYLLREFLGRTASDFSHCGALWSMVARMHIPADPAQRSIWLSKRVEELRSPDDMVAAGMALIVMDIAYSGLAVEVPGLVGALLSLLQRDEPTQMAAAWAFAWLSNRSNPRITKETYVWEAVDDECQILISTLQSRKPIQPETRCCFIVAIGNSKLPRAVDPLLPYLADDDVSVRRVTVRGLGTIGDKQATEPLLRILNDEDFTVRQAVIDVLGQLRDGQAVEPLAALLTESDAGIRQAAIEALGQIGDVRAVESLVALLAESDGSIRQAAIGALGQIGDGRAVEPLRERMDDADPSTRLTIVAALARCGDQRDVQLLITAFVAPDQDERRTAIRAFATVRDQVTQRLLSRDLDAVDPWIAPCEPITTQRVEQAAHKLQMSTDEVRARYETLASDLPLKLAWRAG